jgi:hypothetical protein
VHATHPPPLHTHTCTNTHAHMHTYTHTHSLSLTYTHIQPHTRTHTPHIHTHTTCTHTHSMQVRGRRVWREKRDRSLSHACTASKPTCPTAGNAATQGACVLIGLHVRLHSFKTHMPHHWQCSNTGCVCVSRFACSAAQLQNPHAPPLAMQQHRVRVC